ncbi:family 20 glycosylhydrolase [Lacticaseibacillus mingshuiensis]|uniref:family 20 glycosylhydrolase n=1 Tax=Lacticaseibacillus mingshuiensis TaxID=2799574 RepID=UPI0019502436|nr:family 20 glycosylhydrolase [Lacticaseibacillus mingshuiensis]
MTEPMWQLNAETRLSGAETPAIADLVAIVADELATSGWGLTLPASGGTGKQVLRLALADDMASGDGFAIEATEACLTISAATTRGLLYGLRTVIARLHVAGGWPLGSVHEQPALGERRLFVDAGRKYFSKAWFMDLIHWLSYLRINTLQFHFSENRGFRIDCDTDPAIVSTHHLSKADVREILAEARRYQVDVIPSFDTPGHVEHILKVHPEFGQRGVDGTRSTTGLDITDPAAKAYFRSLYEEYFTLFAGCHDFHIGGDEYMELDREPFLTTYQPVLDAYAKARYGKEATFKDALAGYVADLADLAEEHGFHARVWNDGLYYSENGEQGAPQRIQIDPALGIDYWCPMNWNKAVAELPVFLARGRRRLFNVNSTFFYYVLRAEMPEDGRAQHSFDVPDQDRNIYENWRPGLFAGTELPDDDPRICGAAMAIWCDEPDLTDEKTIRREISSALQAFAAKTWTPAINEARSWTEQQRLMAALKPLAGQD